MADDKSLPADLSPHYLIDPEARWAVVPINSAHYCGCAEPIAPITDEAWESIPELVGAKYAAMDKGAIKRILRKLRTFDVARISPAQLGAIKALCDAATNQAAAKGGETPLLIGVLHHQLLPVTTQEEFKPFESITNLGYLRAVLRDNKFSMVLHGHKHTDYNYFDYIHQPTKPEFDDAPHRLLVVSAGSIRSPEFMKSSICRLINVPQKMMPSSVGLIEIPPVQAGTSLSIPEPKTIRLWQPTMEPTLVSSPVNLVEGKNVEEVYDRALKSFDALGNPAMIPNMICRVAAAETTTKLPSAYPPIPGYEGAKRDEWFKQLVCWWQKNIFSRLSADLHFNHGNRIYHYGKDVDQLQGVVDVLSKDPFTSRALISLFNPTTDRIESSSRFPSFTLVQFIVRDAGDCCYLDVIAYFRKQEVCYWWPVNIAELAMLQSRIHGKVRDKVYSSTQKRPLKCGSITTFAAMAHVGAEVPRMLVPAVDFVFEETPQQLWDMTYALCREELRKQTDYGSDWGHLLANLLPPLKRDSVDIPVPIQGIEYLAEISEHFARHHKECPLGKVAESWKALAKRNRSFADSHSAHDNDAQYDGWRSDVLGHLNTIRALVNGALRANVPELK